MFTTNTSQHNTELYNQTIILSDPVNISDVFVQCCVSIDDILSSPEIKLHLLGSLYRGAMSMDQYLGRRKNQHLYN